MPAPEPQHPDESTATGSIELRLNDLRDRIRELGDEVDTYKAKTAAAVAGGVFLLLIGAGALYDLVSGKANVWSSLGITRNLLWLIAVGGLAASFLLLALAAARQRTRNDARESELQELEEAYTRLSDRLEADQ